MRRYIGGMLLLALGCLTALAHAQEDGNIIRNGDFAAGAAGWWGDGMKSGGVVEEAAAAVGGKCLKVVSDYVCQDKIPAQGGKRYKISMKIKSQDAPDNSVYVQLSYRGSGVDAGWRGPLKWRTEAAIFVTGGTHDWQDFSLVVEAPANADQMLIYLRKESGSAGAAFYDAVSVVETTEGATAVAAQAASTVKSGSELLQNPDFEAGAAGWWGDGMKSGGVVEESPAVGAKCLKVTGGFVCQDKIPVQGGKRYKISMKIKTVDAARLSVYVQLSYRGPGVNAGWYGPLKWRNEAALFLTDGTHDWEDNSIVVEAPAGADQMLLYLRKQSGSAGVAFYDAVSVMETDEPVTVIDSKVTASMRIKPGEQMLENPGFESGQAPWWSEGGKGRVVAEAPAEGEKCLQIEGGYFCQDKIPAQGGKRYKISMKIKSQDAPENSVFVQLSYRGPGVNAGWYGLHKRGNDPVVFLTGGTHDWKDYSVVVEAPQNADQMLVYLRKAGNTAGSAYYDAVSIVETEEAAVTAASLKRTELADKWLAPGQNAQAATLIAAALAQKDKAAPSELALAKDGKALYRVHVGSEEGVIQLYAAAELAGHLGRITGADFAPLSHDANPAQGPLIIVGRENALTATLCPDIPYDTLGNDGFVIRTAGPHIVIAGKTPRGTMYGVYWLLDRICGVRWLSPEYTHIPNKPELVIARPEILQKPRFSYREVFTRELHDDHLAARNLLAGRSHGRAFSPSAPEIDDWDSYWEGRYTANFWQVVDKKKYGQSNPEYFGNQLAMMNPEVRRIAAQFFIDKFKTIPNYEYYYYGFIDMDWGWTMDGQSRTFAAKHGGLRSAPRLDMAIDVANQVRQKLPEAKLAFNAYHWSFTPPLDMQVPDYLLPFPMTIEVDYSTPLNKGRNTQMGKDIEGWAKISPQVLVWDHTVNFHGYLMPTPNIYPICESLQWLASLDTVMGYFAEGSWNTPNAEFSNLRGWVMARLLWDPTLDYKAQVREFCEAYYGPAAPFVFEHIELMHKAIAETGDPLFEKTEIDVKYLGYDYIRRSDELFAKAAAAVEGKAPYDKHVRTERLAVDLTVVLRRAEYRREARKRGEADFTDYDNRMARFWPAVEEAKVWQYRQGGKMDELRQLVTVERKDEIAPAALVEGLDKKDWVEFQEQSFNRYYARTFIVEDSAASDGAAARLDGRDNAWVLQLWHARLPEEGSWEVYAAVRAEPAGGAGADANAFTFGASLDYSEKVNQRAVKFSELKEGEFVYIKIPGGPYKHRHSMPSSFFIHPASEKNVKYVFVDRLVAVRAK